MNIQALHRLDKIILRAHATILIILGLGLVSYTTYARLTGTGLYGFLHENPMAAVGLFQAYLLMALIGTALWLSPTKTHTARWHIIAALAHVPPLASVILFWDALVTYAGANLPAGDIVMHSLFIAIELGFVLYLAFTHSTVRAAS